MVWKAFPYLPEDSRADMIIILNSNHENQNHFTSFPSRLAAGLCCVVNAVWIFYFLFIFYVLTNCCYSWYMPNAS